MDGKLQCKIQSTISTVLNLYKHPATKYTKKTQNLVYLTKALYTLWLNKFNTKKSKLCLNTLKPLADIL